MAVTHGIRPAYWLKVHNSSQTFEQPPLKIRSLEKRCPRKPDADRVNSAPAKPVGVRSPQVPDPQQNPMTTSRKSFRHNLTLLLAFAMLALHAARGQGPEEANPAAVDAIKAWLKSIDEGRYLQSWTSASSQFQKAITSTDWVAALESARKPAGACTNTHTRLGASPGRLARPEWQDAQRRIRHRAMSVVVHQPRCRTRNGYVRKGKRHVEGLRLFH